MGQKRCPTTISTRERLKSSNCVSFHLEKEAENVGKDGSKWQTISPRITVGRFSTQNIVRRAPGPTAHAATRIYAGHEISAFRIFVNEAMIRHICKCTTAEGQCINGDDWRIEPAEMDKFIGLLVARGVSGGCTRGVSKVRANKTSSTNIYILSQ